MGILNLAFVRILFQFYNDSDNFLLLLAAGVLTTQLNLMSTSSPTRLCITPTSDHIAMTDEVIKEYLDLQ